MAGFAKAFGAVTDAASTAWGYAKQLSNSATDQPKLNILGDLKGSSQITDLKGSSLKPLEDSLNGMFTGMIKSGEMILEKWMKYDGKDVEVFEHFSLLASEVIFKTSFGSNFLEANNIFPGTGGIVKMNDDMFSKKLEQTKITEEQFMNDFLKKLLVANQESKNSTRISIEDIADECKAFCYVGRVATASLLGWAIHMLSRDKNLQERARKEVIEMFGRENPNPDGIARLKIVDKILEDCERVYPLVPFIKMKAAGKGVVEEESDKAKSNLQIAFQSFCYGAGTCLGLNFAKIEAKVVLSMILMRFAFTLSPAYSHSPVQGFTVTPKHGIRVILHKLGEESGQMTRIVKTVGVVAVVAVAAWGMYKLVGGLGPEELDQGKKKKETMKNPGRPWELIDKEEFRNDPVARKAIFQRTHNLKKAEKCAKGALGIK